MKKQFITEAQRLQKLAGITEAKVVPQNSLMGLTKSQLIDNIVSFYDVDPQFYEDSGFDSKEEVEDYYSSDKWNTSELIEMIASSEGIYSILKSFYEKNKMIVVDGKDYTDLYLKTIKRFTEAKIVPSTSSILTQKDNPPGSWKETKEDVGETYMDGSIVKRYFELGYGRDTYNSLHINQFPDGKYIVTVHSFYTAIPKGTSAMFDSYKEARDYAWKKMEELDNKWSN